MLAEAARNGWLTPPVLSAGWRPPKREPVAPLLVDSQGRVVGVDADKSLIAIARHSHRRDGLTFEVRDAYDLGFTAEVDVVTSSSGLRGQETRSVR